MMYDLIPEIMSLSALFIACLSWVHVSILVVRVKELEQKVVDPDEK